MSRIISELYLGAGAGVGGVLAGSGAGEQGVAALVACCQTRGAALHRVLEMTIAEPVTGHRATRPSPGVENIDMLLRPAFDRAAMFRLRRRGAGSAWLDRWYFTVRYQRRRAGAHALSAWLRLMRTTVIEVLVPPSAAQSPFSSRPRPLALLERIDRANAAPGWSLGDHVSSAFEHQREVPVP